MKKLTDEDIARVRKYWTGGGTAEEETILTMCDCIESQGREINRLLEGWSHKDGQIQCLQEHVRILQQAPEKVERAVAVEK